MTANKSNRLAKGETFSFELETRKNLGQNFLTDQTVIRDIEMRASSWGQESQKVCLEIGPGSGALTRQLLNNGWTVHAIEKDARAVAGLTSSLAQEFPETLKVIEGDVLKLSPQSFAPHTGALPLCIGNIPYYITSDILLWFLKHQKDFCAGIFMVQKEVADRLASGPGNKSYGRLTVRAQLSCQVEQFMHVPARAFAPPPKVDSAVVELSPRIETELSNEELSQFERFTALLFSARRKMLRKTIIQSVHQILSLPETGVNEESITNKADALGIRLSQRPEELSPIQILKLFRVLKGEH